MAAIIVDVQYEYKYSLNHVLPTSTFFPIKRLFANLPIRHFIPYSNGEFIPYSNGKLYRLKLNPCHNTRSDQFNLSQYGKYYIQMSHIKKYLHKYKHINFSIYTSCPVKKKL